MRSTTWLTPSSALIWRMILNGTECTNISNVVSLVTDSHTLETGRYKTGQVEGDYSVRYTRDPSASWLVMDDTREPPIWTGPVIQGPRRGAAPGGFLIAPKNGTN